MASCVGRQAHGPILPSLNDTRSSMMELGIDRHPPADGLAVEGVQDDPAGPVGGVCRPV